jgi:hypothetical protein
MTAHWKCDAWWVMSYSGPIAAMAAHIKCEWLSYSGPILVLFWSYCCNKQLLLTQSKAFSTINILISHNKHNPKLNNQQLQGSMTSDPNQSFIKNRFDNFKRTIKSTTSRVNHFKPNQNLSQQSTTSRVNQSLLKSQQLQESMTSEPNQSFLNNLKQLYAQLLVSFPADWQTINFW